MSGIGLKPRPALRAGESFRAIRGIEEAVACVEIAPGKLPGHLGSGGMAAHALEAAASSKPKAGPVGAAPKNRERRPPRSSRRSAANPNRLIEHGSKSARPLA